MTASSRRKGHDYERLLVGYLREALRPLGLEVSRNLEQERDSGADIHVLGAAGLVAAIEAKRWAALRPADLRDAIDQVLAADLPAGTARIVSYRVDREPGRHLLVLDDHQLVPVIGLIAHRELIVRSVTR